MVQKKKTYPDFISFPIGYKLGSISIRQHITSHPLMRVPSALCGDSCNASNISKVYLQILTSVIHTCTPWTDRIESSQPRSQVVIVICWSTKGTVLYSFVFQTKGKSTTSWKDDKLRRKGVSLSKLYWMKKAWHNNITTVLPNNLSLLLCISMTLETNQ